MKVFHQLAFLSCLATLGLISNIAFAEAKSLSLYAEPNASAKVVGTIDPANGVIPIFTPKDNEWMKVGDPANGNVGWVKQSDLKANSSVTFTQKIIQPNGSGSQGYKFDFTNGPKKMSNEEINAMITKMQNIQIPPATQKAMTEMLENIQKQWKTMMNNGVGTGPVIMPVIIMPNPAQSSAPVPPVKNPR